MKDCLVLLVGPSGSGKTTITKELEKEGYNIINSYTTRPPREPNEWGHIFVPTLDDEKTIYLEEISAETNKSITRPYIYEDSLVIAYHHIYGHHYWATQVQYQGKGTSIYAITPDGAKQVQKNVTDAEIITIYLVCDADIRIDRMLLDGRKPREIIERLEKDTKIFAKCKCDYVVDANRELLEVLADIKDIIEEHKKC